MEKHFDSRGSEEKILKLWEKNRCFSPNLQAKKNYSIIMPPPNANDPLHIGHAMFVTLEDILIRFHRLLGEATLWLPGTDHAGIETQFVFEKKLQKQGKSRFHYDRDSLYQEIKNYVLTNSAIVLDQLKKLGASASFEDYKFTLDEKIVSTVIDTFVKLNQDGLIYRANKLVNYCPKCGTAFSNLEVKHTSNFSPLYYIKYGPLTLATTRPETKFADIALAVHPTDPRYKRYHHQTIRVKDLEKDLELKVIPDDFVDPQFGTGVVKITPLHDFNDFEFYQRHQDELPVPQLAVNHEGRLTAITGKYQGLKVAIAREQVVQDLKKANLLEKIDTHYQNQKATCYRCGTAIEPLPLPQVYLKVKPLVKPVLKAIKDKQVKIYGAGHDKILLNWLKILNDWNISRQIVWGIRIPLFYDSKLKENQLIKITFLDQAKNKQSGLLGELLKRYPLEIINQGLQSLEAPIEAKYEIAKESPGNHYLQETDTFDTWFSSGQWPYATLKNSSPDYLKRFYPTDCLETAYDILMFWVMRMLMFGIYQQGEVPFKSVYLHGLIRDNKGQKMSKSKGNVVDPLVVVEKYGADALRMALVIRSSAGLDKSIGDQDFKAMRNFSNKIWNASRYLLLQKEKIIKDQAALDTEVETKIQKLKSTIKKQLNNYQLGLSAETIYNEFWHWFCDQVIEDSKKGLISYSVLIASLKSLLALLHPFMPFVTEAVWQELKKEKLVKEDLLITASQLL